jgi:hypothetical protein
LRRSFARAGFDKDLAHNVEAEKVEGNPTPFAGYTCVIY